MLQTAWRQVGQQVYGTVVPHLQVMCVRMELGARYPTPGQGQCDRLISRDNQRHQDLESGECSQQLSWPWSVIGVVEPT